MFLHSAPAGKIDVAGAGRGSIASGPHGLAAVQGDAITTASDHHIYTTNAHRADELHALLDAWNAAGRPGHHHWRLWLRFAGTDRRELAATVVQK